MGRTNINKAKQRTWTAKLSLPLTLTILFTLCLASGLFLPGMAQASGTVAACSDCHGYPPTDGPRSAATGSFLGSHSKHAGSMGLGCSVCHVSPNWTTFNHQNGIIQINGQWGTYSKGASFPQSNNPTLGSCSGVYCHSSVQADGGSTTGVTYARPVWGSVGTAQCGSCHSNPAATGKHAKHTAAPLNIACSTCHSGAGTGTAYHANGTIDIIYNGAIAGASASYSKGSHAPGAGYGSCSSVYCHGNFTNSGGTSMTPGWTTVGGPSQTCGNCHAATAATPPPGGSHLRHAGAWTTSVQLACTKCHGANGIGTIGHQNRNVQWAFDTTDPRLTIATYRGAATGSTGGPAPSAAYGSCTNVYCHSNVQNFDGTAGPTRYASEVWGSVGTVKCGNCHDFPNTTGAHLNHINVYNKTMTTVNTCQICHYKAGDETVYHARGTINLVLNTIYGITDSAYSKGSHKAGGGGFGNCTNTYCHGGPTKIWSSVTTYAQCTKCHGVKGATPAQFTADNKIAAPGYVSAAVPGTGTDTWGTISGFKKTVGAHDTHLRGLNTIASPIQCNQCHIVPAAVTDAGHNLDGNPATMTWGTLAKGLPSYSMAPWYSSGNATCSNYCHGGNMPNGSTGGNTRNPTWTSNGMLTGFRAVGTVVGDCQKCHASPPATGSHGGNEQFSQCGACHSYVNADGTFNNVTLHLNGVFDGPVGGGACPSCHNASFKKTKGSAIGTIRLVVGPGGDFNMSVVPAATRHLFGATTITKYDCAICHAEGDFSGAPGALHQDGLINLRNVDTTNGSGWAIDNRNWGTADYTNMDYFCLSCHDANGAAAASVGATGLGTGDPLRPFNATDFAAGYLGGSTTLPNTPRQRVVNIKDKLYPGTNGPGATYNGNPSQHAVLGARYSTPNANWGTTWTNVGLKKMGVALNVTKETSLLSCADCHVLDGGPGGNAHAGKNRYNMGTTDLVSSCWKCHKKTTYFDGAGPGTRMNHNIDGSWNGTEGGYGFAASGFVNCLTCHASWDGTTTVSRQASGLGGIHGSWSSTAMMDTPVKSAQRFFPGSYFKVGWGSDGGWSQTGATVSCYFWSRAQSSASACTSHSNTAPATRSNTTNYSRPMKY